MAVVFRKRSKYRNKLVRLDGLIFASKKEANRYEELFLMQKAGLISKLEIHPQFDIVIHGFHICKVIPDFSYLSSVTGTKVVEDVKSPVSRTQLYKLKKGLMKAVLGIDVHEL